jgi:hypothetical protein
MPSPHGSRPCRPGSEAAISGLWNEAILPAVGAGHGPLRRLEARCGRVVAYLLRLAMIPPMAILGRKTITPEETAALVSATAVSRGLEQAKDRIVSILGRKPPFVRVHVGHTDADLGKAPQDRGGYTVTALFSAGSAPVTEAVGKAVGTWLLACHGKRFEAEPAKPVVKPGAKTLYLAVAYQATA